MRYARIAAFALGLITCATHAEEQGEPAFDYQAAAMGEVAALTLAAIATLNPKVYGAGLALIYGFAKMPEDTTNATTPLVARISGEGVAAYNLLALNRDDTDRKSFISNVIANHLFAAAVLTASKLTHEREGQPKLSVNYGALRDGGFLQFAYEF